MSPCEGVGDDIMNANPMEQPLAEVDPEIAQAIENEERRQHEGLELIASENFVERSRARSDGLGVHQQICRRLSRQALLRRLRVHRRGREPGASTAPSNCSGPSTPTCSRIQDRTANMAAYAAVIQPGDTILGLNLAHGGHLTHGHPLNFSGKTYKIVPYGVTKETETIDYDELERIAEREQPEADHRWRQRLSAHSSTSRVCGRSPTKSARIYLVDMAHFAGLVAAERIRRRCRTRRSSPPPRTRRCAVRAPA